jgi:hypothetical protein
VASSAEHDAIPKVKKFHVAAIFRARWFDDHVVASTIRSAWTRTLNPSTKLSARKARPLTLRFRKFKTLENYKLLRIAPVERVGFPPRYDFETMRGSNRLPALVTKRRAESATYQKARTTK